MVLTVLPVSWRWRTPLSTRQQVSTDKDTVKVLSTSYLQLSHTRHRMSTGYDMCYLLSDLMHAVVSTSSRNKLSGDKAARDVLLTAIFHLLADKSDDHRVNSKPCMYLDAVPDERACCNIVLCRWRMFSKLGGNIQVRAAQTHQPKTRAGLAVVFTRSGTLTTMSSAVSLRRCRDLLSNSIQRLSVHDSTDDCSHAVSEHCIYC
jgi:hypothetical protein